MTQINVEDARAGVIVMNGLVGNCLEMFEIRLHEGTFHYWVRNVEVPVETYRDALVLANLDRFDPRDTSGKFVMTADGSDLD
jgi:hypothetical protein